MPKHLWERIKLPRNYEKAPELIDKHLEKVMSSMPMRDMKRELRRDEKTKIAAVLDKAIETLKSVYYPDILNYLEKNVEVEEEEEEEEEVLLFFFSKQSIKHFENHDWHIQAS
ncbi:BnaC01g31980D [Brassica napus]|uniref:BnaC01g31980D protein n=2 Tax=Brassica TaxID=3705 RepID=A0A078G2M3_BRANA|nr:BnaC01g31980D [Brassica napus]